MRRQTGLAVLVACGALVAVGCVAAQSSGSGKETLAAAKTTLDRNATMTVYPVSLAGQPVAQVGEVVGMMLERGGMPNLELATTSFAAPAGADLAATTAAFGEFIKAHPGSTQYALYAQFLGSPQKGVNEVRTIIVDQSGAVVWSDSQTAKDADFKRIQPHEPLDCCVLVTERLQPVFGLSDSTRDDAPPGRLAKAWERNTGLPDKAGFAAIEARATALRGHAADATVTVYRPHVGAGAAASADDLTTRINTTKAMKASAAGSTPELTIRNDMNEQKVLWSMANSFSDYLRANPPATEYALFADYLMGANQKGEIRVGAVHFVLCNKAGEVVIADFRNSHFEDFNQAKLDSAAACDAFVAQRLAAQVK